MTTRLVLLALAGSLLGAAPAFAALGTSTSQTVGLVALRIPGVSNRALSLPLDPAPTHVDTIARVSKRTVTWRLDPEQISVVDRRKGPLALRVLTGPSAGVAFEIVSARETSATLRANEDFIALASSAAGWPPLQPPGVQAGIRGIPYRRTRCPGTPAEPAGTWSGIGPASLLRLIVCFEVGIRMQCSLDGPIPALRDRAGSGLEVQDVILKQRRPPSCIRSAAASASSRRR